jgi:O-antigen ligase
MDITESDTRAYGGVTRVSLFQDWIGKLNGEPWYGYGLLAMAGSQADPKDPQRVMYRGMLPVGTHNTYLGVLIDTGPIGLIALLAMLLYYTKVSLSFAGPPIVRWALVSLLGCNLVILFVSHNHLFSFEGQCATLLFLLLPSCDGLREYPRRRAKPGWAGPLSYIPTPVVK